MKHAYLIIAHNEFTLLQYLIKALDDERNDIYVHFDKKVTDIPKLMAKHAGLYLTKERVDVRWGDVSVVEAEYVLFEAAAKRARYGYYHLLSGVDMPLKGQEEIHLFFNANQGKEFIGFSQYDYAGEVERKVQKYHLFSKDFKFNGGLVSLCKKALRFLFIRVQNIVGYKRHRSTAFKKGTQWVSVTHDFVEYLCIKKEEVMKIYHHTFCSDEIYKQTLCWHSTFKSSLYDLEDEGTGCMRKIGWANGQLSDWTEKNYEALIQSKALFARKFNSKHIEVVHQIMKELN
ncbi:beta-1,6-N-acetylglucosaminyltransferase [Sphingobacterium sp. SGR-19]|uniref:beta-1,6-N-acetylglucosaminyltransferase n=1 Tax=Sphingobacterium sp. SGR-19 TaxID=2710886 RepID=UPI0013EE139D|nr:beta-1,6-N-acetylglucosaminyltransferase [Sphingobacterium sp. SGR-19]NGM64062.1 beta-1,6-N-acetylglucosaminyltransferase [Sphingobacterium sp. SGR-19]